jgi:hypothetical protein
MQHDNVTVVGMFESSADARYAVDRLRDSGLRIDDVSVVERDPARYEAGRSYADAPYEYREYTTEELGNETAGGLVVGALVGGTLGTLAGLGALVIPGIGPILAAGPLAGALIGGSAGAVTGTVVGALIEAFNVPEEHAEIYTRRLSEGRTMVAVHADPADAAGVQAIFRESNAERFEWAEPTVREERRYYWV